MKILVRDILSLKEKDIFMISLNDLLPKAVEMMVTKNIGSLLVMEKDKLVGQITFKEVLEALHFAEGNITSVLIKDVMVQNMIFGSPEDSMEKVKELMLRENIRYLPVLQGVKLIGILSFRDIARAALKTAKHENTMLKQYIKNWPEDEKGS